MKRPLIFIWLAVIFCVGNVPLAGAENTLAKIDKSGTLTIGTRRGSPPFAYVNSSNEWV